MRIARENWNIGDTVLRAFVLFVLFTPALAFAATSGPSPIPPAPNFKVTTSTQTVCKGITNEVPITVSDVNNNEGNPSMDDVQFSLSNRNIYQSGNSITINSIANNTSATVEVPAFVDLNASGLMTVQVPIQYTFDELYQDNEVENLTMEAITCANVSPITVNVSTSVLISGQINNLTFSFDNIGNSTLYNVSAQTYVSGSQTGIQFIDHKPIVISSLLPHSAVNVTQRMYENGSQIFPLNITVMYFNGTRLGELSDSFTMLSGGTVDMVPSSLSVTPSTVTAGGIFSLSFIITDTGTGGVSDANATAILPDGFKNYGVSSSDFIGGISPQSPTPVSLSLEASSTLKSGTYTIPVKLSYLGGFRQSLSSIVNVTVNVSSSGSTSSGLSSSSGASSTGASSSSSDIGLLILVGTFVVVLAVVLYAGARRRRKTESQRSVK